MWEILLFNDVQLPGRLDFKVKLPLVLVLYFLFTQFFFFCFSYMCKFNLLFIGSFTTIINSIENSNKYILLLVCRDSWILERCVIVMQGWSGATIVYQKVQETSLKGKVVMYNGYNCTAVHIIFSCKKYVQQTVQPTLLYRRVKSALSALKLELLFKQSPNKYE